MAKPQIPRKSKPERKAHGPASHPYAGMGMAKDPRAAYASRSKERVVSFLGLASKRASTEGNDNSYFIDLIRKGVPKKVIDEIMSKTGLSEDEMADILHISRRTIQRRDPYTPLNPEQSERLIEMAKLYSKGEDILGGIDDFIAWMDQRIWALGDKRPKEFLDTSIGIGMLMDELDRIRFGVYS